MTVENLFFLSGVSSFLIAIVALFKPDIFLKWASDGKKTRFRAFCFWILISLIFWSCGASATQTAHKYAWVTSVILCLCAVLMGIYLRKFNPQLSANAHKRAEEASRKKLAKQEKQAEKERRRQEIISAKMEDTEQQRRKLAEAKAKQKRIQERKDKALTDALLDNPGVSDIVIYNRIERAYDRGDFDDPSDANEYNDNIEIGYACTEANYDNDWIIEWQQILRITYGKKPNSTHDRKFRQLFGGDRQCLYNFSMYEARIRRGEILCVVPSDDYYRQRFDVLAANGIAKKFSAFNPELLKALTLPQIREVGRAAGLKSLRVDKAGSLKMLMELPEETLAQAWPAAGIEIDSIFKLRNPEDIYTEVKTTS